MQLAHFHLNLPGTTEEAFRFYEEVFGTNIVMMQTFGQTPFAGSARLGGPAPDAPVRCRDGRDGFLLEQLGGRFDLIHVRGGEAPRAPDGISLTVIGADLADRSGLFAQRFDASPGATYLLRPDQHLCARWRAFDADKVMRARDRALGR